jgi:hypothetical protein
MMTTGDDRNDSHAPPGQKPERPEKPGSGAPPSSSGSPHRKRTAASGPGPGFGHDFGRDFDRDFDPWADWKPQWQSLQRETKARRKGKNPAPAAAGKNSAAVGPHDMQERHSPTETVTTRLDAARTEERHQRRIVDARLWDGMSAPQQSAALEIARAFETMGKGLGYVTSDWTRIPGCRGPGHAAEIHSRLINAYVDWTKQCHREKISHSMVIDILVFGFTCRALDRDRRVRAGAARDNLLAGLSLYCQLRGWSDK